MPSFIAPGFCSWDANQAGGAVDVSDTIELADPVFGDSYNGVDFNAWGATRVTQLPGLLQVATITYRYRPADTSTQQYEDAIASFDDKSLQTFVITRIAGAASTTNHQYTVTFYEQNSPASGLMHGNFVHYAGQGMIQSVVHYDGTTTYTWD